MCWKKVWPVLYNRGQEISQGHISHLHRDYWKYSSNNEKKKSWTNSCKLIPVQEDTACGPSLPKHVASHINIHKHRELFINRYKNNTFIQVFKILITFFLAILVDTACIFPFNFMERINIEIQKEECYKSLKSKTAVYWSFPVEKKPCAFLI